MPIPCPVTFDVKRLRTEVQSMYSRVADAPYGEFHFHRGPAYAASMLGYDAAELSLLPPIVTSSFAGVANPHVIAPLPVGATVLDIGCGAGTDLLLAARHVGPGGRAIGVDMTAAMRSRATDGARECGLANVDVRAGDATNLPIDDASVDIVISNGVLNLVPEKERAIAEIARILKPGGRVQIGDIVIGTELDDEALADIDLWTGWIAGALLEAEMIGVFQSAGFTSVEITQRFDCFVGTTKERTARKYGVIGVNVAALRGSV